MIAEVKREIQMRENFYPLRIRDRKLNAKAAHWQISVMRAVLAQLIRDNGGKDSAPGILI